MNIENITQAKKEIDYIGRLDEKLDGIKRSNEIVNDSSDYSRYIAIRGHRCSDFVISDNEEDLKTVLRLCESLLKRKKEKAINRLMNL